MKYKKKLGTAAGVVLIAGCIQSQKAPENATAENAVPQTPIDRGVASREAPSDYEPDRFTYQGTVGDFTRELRLMKGNLEREKVLNITQRRDDMLLNNLYDTGVDEAPASLDCKQHMAMGRTDYVLHHRTPTGLCYMYNQGKFYKGQHESDLSSLKMMGAKGQRFGRNTKPPTKEERETMAKEVLFPDPVKVSQAFFSRKNSLAPQTKGFQPVPWVNLLATAWLQAQNHDWFTHGKNVNLSHLTPEQQQKYAALFRPYEVGGYTIPRTVPDMSLLEKWESGKKFDRQGKGTAFETEENHYGKKFRNAVTHWWDASHVYGSDEATIKKVRTVPSSVTFKDPVSGQTYQAGQIYPDGRIAVDKENRKLYYRPDPENDGEILPITGFHDNWWMGLEMIHTTFALEHNQVIDFLIKDFERPRSARDKDFELYKYYQSIKKDPVKRGDFLFEKARLVVSALIAKIHTVEWTPAILDNPGLRFGMFTNWNGAKTIVGDPESPTARGWIDKYLGEHARMLVSGLTGEGTLNQFGVPFTLTEEFVSVYRMHALLSDEVQVMPVNRTRDEVIATIPVDFARDGAVEQILTGQVRVASNANRDPSSTDWMYSFGRNKAGLMTLHNYPKFMDNMTIRRNIKGQKQSEAFKMNMGAVDLVRDRERQVPRYNGLRRALKLRPIKRFEELFITSKVLYENEDVAGKAQEYKDAIRKLRATITQKEGYDTTYRIERNLDKIPGLEITQVIKNARGGFSAILNDGKKLVPEEVFYDYYFGALTPAEQNALLTPQEIEDIAKMKELYNNDVEKLDLLVGTLAEEDRFDAFGFGNTPFFIFALMASRRLMADPFFSDMYTDAVYSAGGRNWVEKENMVSVLARNFPELKPHFKNIKNAFHPWNPSGM